MWRALINAGIALGVTLFVLCSCAGIVGWYLEYDQMQHEIALDEAEGEQE